jgi:hypothetical protein
VVLITAGAPENSRKTCSPGSPTPGGNHRLKRTWVGNISTVLYENGIKIKNKPNLKSFKTLNLYNETICRPLPIS